ncbi:MAG TPA: hypothetical protein V6C95_16535 [Coleofasciculaceae cyanobacterium]
MCTTGLLTAAIVPHPLEKRYIRIWNLENQNELFTLIGHTDSVNAVAVTPDRSRVISVSSDNTLKVWDLENRKSLQLKQCDRADNERKCDRAFPISPTLNHGNRCK